MAAGESLVVRFPWVSMARTLVLLIAASLLALGTVFSSAAGSAAVARVECNRPRTLKLRRFEDGSAWLECGGRTLVRIGVPG